MLRRLVPMAAVGAVALMLVSASGGDVSPKTYDLTARQAQEVSVAVRFFDAFNAHRLRQALSLLTPNVTASDCDYRRIRTIDYSGKAEVARWLRQRFADHDHLTVVEMLNANPEGAVGGLGVAIGHRTNDTLRRLGFPQGISLSLISKVAVTTTGPILIRAFGFGNHGPQDVCEPHA